jgi:type I restriction enzyme S subunit
LVVLRQPHLNAVYLQNLLRVHYSTLNGSSRGVGIPHVDPEVFDALMIPLISKDAQEKVSAFLASIRASLSELKYRTTMMQECVSELKDQLLATAAAGELLPYKDGNHGRSSESWQIVELGALAQLITSGSRGWAILF